MWNIYTHVLAPNSNVSVKLFELPIYLNILISIKSFLSNLFLQKFLLQLFLCLSVKAVSVSFS